MGYQTKVQVIDRANKTRQFYFIFPAPLAEAMEFRKGEIIEWVVVDKNHLAVKRRRTRSESRRGKGGKR